MSAFDSLTPGSSRAYRPEDLSGPNSDANRNTGRWRQGKIGLNADPSDRAADSPLENVNAPSVGSLRGFSKKNSSPPNFESDSRFQLQLDTQTLSNGVEIITVPVLGADNVRVEVVPLAGARHDPPGEEGSTHVGEHCAQRMTHGLSPELVHVSESGDSVRREAQTQREITRHVLTTTAPEVLQEVFSKVAPVLDQLPSSNDVRDEVRATLRELELMNTKPGFVATNLLMEAIYGTNSRLAHSPFGKSESLAELVEHPDRVREHVERCHQPDNIKVLITGSPTAALVDQVSEFFGKLPDVGASDVWRPDAYLGGEEPVLAKPGDPERAVIRIGYPVIGAEVKDARVMQLISVLLGGGGVESKLGEELAELGAEERDVRYIDLSDTGVLCIGLTARNGSSVDSLSAIGQELGRLRSEIISVEELERARQALIESLGNALETTEGISTFLSKSLVTQGNFGEVALPEAYLRPLVDVTPEDVHRVALDILSPERLRVGMLGGQIPATAAVNYLQVASK